MYKLVKWAYKMGYKHAETKYYHTLRDRVVSYRQTELDIFGFDDKSKYDKKQLMENQEISSRLERIIREVFKPEIMTENLPVVVKDRFEP